MQLEKAKTVDGQRLNVSDLNTNLPSAMSAKPQGPWSKLTTAYRNLSDVMAGMYTGVRCGGVPHSHHSYDKAIESPPKSKDTDPNKI